jgi:DNA-binding Lrp family transcriptional regulator
MAVPPNELEKIAAQINQYPQIAHNYEREHDYNLWFVIATETPEEIATILAQIEQETGYAVMNLPKEDEFYVGLYFDV